jgi:hypothetical protein
MTKVVLKIKRNCVKFEITAAVTLKNAIFSNVKQSDLAEIPESQNKATVAALCSTEAAIYFVTVANFYQTTLCHVQDRIF